MCLRATLLFWEFPMKKKKTLWVKKRHAAVFAFLRAVLTPIFRLKYRYRAEKSSLKKGPCLILHNHQATMDPFFVAASFRRPIYFFTSDDLFNLKVSPLIKFLVAPIPKSKSLADMNAVKCALRVLKEGGAVAVAPEGNRTLSGRLWEISDSIAKLAKLAKVPVVLYNICGGYGTDPRWGHGVRRGTRFEGRIGRVLVPEDYQDLSVAELHALIVAGLDVDDTASGERFKSRCRAEYIERALYLCPVCHAVGSIASHGAGFSCKACGTAAEYTEELAIAPPYAGYSKIYEWYEWERREIAERVLRGERISDTGILFRESIRFKRKKKLAGDTVWIDREAITVTGEGAVSRYPLADITAVTAVGKKKFNFYYRGQTLQIKGDKRFCSIKYVHVFDGVRAARHAERPAEARTEHAERPDTSAEEPV